MSQSSSSVMVSNQDDIARVSLAGMSLHDDDKNLVEERHVLPRYWTYYYHLQDDKNWDLDSYKVIQADIHDFETVLLLNQELPDFALYNCMFFLMRQGVTPMWEDPLNHRGGCFSYRVLNNHVGSVWKDLVVAMTGEFLFEDRDANAHVNGITISPKKNFCIIKIWLDTCTITNAELIVNIRHLPRTGCLFKKHGYENPASSSSSSTPSTDTSV